MIYLLTQEWHRPGDQVNVVWKSVRGIHAVELFDADLTLGQDHDRALVAVAVAIVRCRENGDDVWEGVRLVPSVHLVPFHLNFMSSHHRDKVVFL